MVVPLAQISKFGSRQQDPGTASETHEQHHLGPPRDEEKTWSRGSDVGPVKGQIQESHATEARTDKVCDVVARRNPAQERERPQHGKDVFGQELP